MEKPLVNKKYRLQKYPGKGGWTYASIAEISKNKRARFGYVKVKGSIDGYPIQKYHLMPMSNGSMFFPVKAAIRKQIKKNEGDFVHIILFQDKDPLEVPEEMLLCLQDEPAALKFFTALSESEQRFYIQWIYAAKQEQTKINRLAKAVNRLAKALKFYEKENAQSA
ncbi:MAG: YdeI/OmpD-associated family protein [Bacteroidota bacterium]